MKILVSLLFSTFLGTSCKSMIKPKPGPDNKKPAPAQSELFLFANWCSSKAGDECSSSQGCVWNQTTGHCLSAKLSSCSAASTFDQCEKLYFCGWSLVQKCNLSFWTKNESKKTWVNNVTNPKKYTKLPNDSSQPTPKNICTSATENSCQQKNEAEIQNSLFKSGEFQAQLDNISDSVLSVDNKIEIIANGESFKKKLKLIKSAKTSINTAYFLISCDDSGIAFNRALVAAAKRGVQVNVIISGDWESWLQTLNLNRSIKWESRCTQILVDRGIKLYNTSIVTNWLLHEKLLVIDGHTAIVGGQNISDAWSKSNGHNEYFRDTDTLVSGPVVTQIEKKFLNMLKQLHADPKDYKAFANTLADKEKIFSEKRMIGNVDNQYSQWFNEGKSGLCRFIHQEPHRNYFALLNAYVFLVEHLKSNLLMEVPQLSMGEEYKDAKRNQLRDAILNFSENRNGHVDILTNGPGYRNSKIIDDYYLALQSLPSKVLNYMKNYAARSFASRTYDNVVGKNLNVYTYHRWHHGKIWLFDDTIVSNGSFNYDESAEDWSECALMCIDGELTKKTKEILTNDMRYSLNMTLPD
ncbi:MAG: phosphatidylserine/phosphatidylglycerophosphate/cardiolipin synthase family protein [Deltaproteobacteria bacterium]|nr:phosphatidylserine/phosphatidylglycerophosphate/cardiolipin synthase family protein [Deltaproteobacteria bacterium]